MKIARLRNLEKVVEEILKDEPLSREDDFYLVLKVVQRLYPEECSKTFIEVVFDTKTKRINFKEIMNIKNEILAYIDEIWKDVVGYEGIYKVSNLGRIKNKKGHLIRPHIKWNGYAEFKTFDKKHIQIHRAVAEAFIPNPNKLRQVNHKNEIKFDNRVENLEWCNNSYNVRYSLERRQKK